MRDSLKYNRSLLNGPKPYSQLKEEFNRYKYELEFEDKKLSKPEAEKLKKQIRAKMIQHRRKESFILLTIGFIAACLLASALYFIFT